MQRGSSASRSRLPVLAEPSEAVVDTLMARPEQWFLVAGSDYCRAPDDHPDRCRCGVRVLTQTAHRIRRRDLGAFAYVDKGCFEAVASSAADRPGKQFDVEIRARFTTACS